MKRKIIQLPKGYLSYSQIQLWQSDKERYKEIYFNNRDELRVSNAGMDFGKEVATALEHGNHVEDVLTDIAMDLLPKYDIADQEIVAEMKTKDGWITIKGRPDTMDSKSFAFREYKTGKVKWTQKKAESALQLKIYAVLIYIVHKKILHEAHLDWIETHETPEGIKPTGRVESFRVPITFNAILETMALITRVAKEIETEWVTYVRPVEEPF